VHPEYYAGTLANDIAILTLDHDVDFSKNPHINPACLPNKYDDFTGTRYVLSIIYKMEEIIVKKIILKISY